MPRPDLEHCNENASHSKFILLLLSLILALCWTVIDERVDAQLSTSGSCLKWLYCKITSPALERYNRAITSPIFLEQKVPR
jgi:hypothetical protein